VLPEGITTDPQELKAIREWPTPKNKHEISLLELYAYYRRFISGYTNVTKLLFKLMEEKQAFQCGLQKWRTPFKH
jgi:hypothetical protein